MTRLLRLKLPRSTNFGNAKPLIWKVPCTIASDSGLPSAGNADFVVTQTHLCLLDWDGVVIREACAKIKGFGEVFAPARPNQKHFQPRHVDAQLP